MHAPSVTLVRVFDRYWAAWLHNVEACRRKATPAAVHALRTGCRRLEALVEVVCQTTGASPKSLRRLTKLAGRPLDASSALRDDQVQRRRIRRVRRGRRAPGMDALLGRVRRREARHSKRVRRVLRGIDLTRAADTASRVRRGVVSRQGAPTPRDRTLRLLMAVDAAAAEARRRLERADCQRPRTLHRLRMAIKRLRYVTEVAGEVSPDVRVSAQPALRTMRTLQRRLGAVHDADVLLRRLAGRKRRHREDVRAFRAAVKSARAKHLRALATSLPALPRALHDLAVRASNVAAARAL